MQGPKTSSTLELVVNEQQLQNMSTIDLSRSVDATATTTGTHGPNSLGLSINDIKKWPERLREGFNARIDEAKSKSETKTEFVIQVLQSFSGVFVWAMCFICTITVPILLFFIGLLNLDDCPDKPSLPYLVFVSGFLMTASNLFNLALTLNLPVLTNHQFLSADTKNIIASIINMIYNTIVALLYILCAYMVYTTKPTNSGQQSTQSAQEPEIDCNIWLYYSTYWFITSTLSLIILLCLVGGCLYAYNRYRLAIIRGSTPRPEPSPPPVDPYLSNRV